MTFISELNGQGVHLTIMLQNFISVNLYLCGIYFIHRKLLWLHGHNKIDYPSKCLYIVKT